MSHILRNKLTKKKRKQEQNKETGKAHRNHILLTQKESHSAYTSKWLLESGRLTPKPQSGK